MKIAIYILMVLNIIIYAVSLNPGAFLGWGLALLYFHLWEENK